MITGLDHVLAFPRGVCEARLVVSATTGGSSEWGKHRMPILKSLPL
jgi:hypothetical protein